MKKTSFMESIEHLSYDVQLAKMVKYIGGLVDFNIPIKLKYQDKENDTKPYTVEVINLSDMGALIFYPRRNGGRGNRFYARFEDFDKIELFKLHSEVFKEYDMYL